MIKKMICENSSITKIGELRKRYDIYWNNYIAFPSVNGYEEKNERKQFSNRYTKLKTNNFAIKFMDIPEELFKSVSFISEHMLEIIFFESAEFCVEKYFQTNFDIIKGKKINIKYLDKERRAVRTDSYIVENINNIERDSLTNEVKDITIKITFDCKSHDISTCKE